MVIRARCVDCSWTVEKTVPSGDRQAFDRAQFALLKDANAHLTDSETCRRVQMETQGNPMLSVVLRGP